MIACLQHMYLILFNIDNVDNLYAQELRTGDRTKLLPYTNFYVEVLTQFGIILLHVEVLTKFWIKLLHVEVLTIFPDIISTVTKLI